MKTFEVQTIAIEAPAEAVFTYVADPHRLPQWAHAFRAVADGRARLHAGHAVLPRPPPPPRLRSGGDPGDGTRRGGRHPRDHSGRLPQAPFPRPPGDRHLHPGPLRPGGAPQGVPLTSARDAGDAARPCGSARFVARSRPRRCRISRRNLPEVYLRSSAVFVLVLLLGACGRGSSPTGPSACPPSPAPSPTPTPASGPTVLRPRRP